MQLDAVDLGDAGGDGVVRSSRVRLAGKSCGEKQQAEHCQTQSALHRSLLEHKKQVSDYTVWDMARPRIQGFCLPDCRSPRAEAREPKPEVRTPKCYPDFIRTNSNES